MVATPAAPEHGGFAQRLFVDQTRVLPALDALTDVEAALVEPAAVALHGIRRAGVVTGDVVVVQGAGPIGVLAAQCARVAGAAAVVEPQEGRRSLAVTLGADVAVAPGEAAALLVDELTEGRGADVVVECAGRSELLATALGLTRRGGTVLLLGYTAQAATVRPATLLSRELVVRGAGRDPRRRAPDHAAHRGRPAAGDPPPHEHGRARGPGGRAGRPGRRPVVWPQGAGRPAAVTPHPQSGSSPTDGTAPGQRLRSGHASPPATRSGSGMA